MGLEKKKGEEEENNNNNSVDKMLCHSLPEWALETSQEHCHEIERMLVGCKVVFKILSNSDELTGVAVSWNTSLNCRKTG